VVGVSGAFGPAFAFVLVFAFAFALVLAFAFAIFSDIKSVAAARSVFGGHVTVLLEEKFSERAECASVERVSSCPSRQIGVKLNEWFDGPGEGIDASEFWDSVAGGCEELVIEVYVAAKIAEIEEVGERGGDNCLSDVYLLLGDSAKHCFELSDQVQRSEGPGVELVLGVDIVEGDAA
jgi:hypothetical protein